MKHSPQGFLLLFVANLSLAACPTDIYGQSEGFSVKILQDCGVKSEIEVSRFDDQTLTYSEPYIKVLFNKECKFIKDESRIVCNPKGKTILAGATYKRTSDETPTVCPGSAVEDRFTCIKGCTKVVPRYLSIAPYEC